MAPVGGGPGELERPWHGHNAVVSTNLDTVRSACRQARGERAAPVIREANLPGTAFKGGSRGKLHQWRYAIAESCRGSWCEPWPRRSPAAPSCSRQRRLGGGQALPRGGVG